MKLEKGNEAFEYTERSKSKTFLDMIATTEIKPSDELIVEKSLLEEEKSCLGRLRIAQMRHLGKSEVPFELGEVDGIFKELNDIYGKMEKIDPEYVFTRRAKPLSFDEIIKMLSTKNRSIVNIQLYTKLINRIAFYYL